MKPAYPTSLQVLRRKQLVRLWMAIGITLLLSAYWLTVNLNAQLRAFFAPYTSLPVAEWSAHFLYGWLLALLWLANRRWRDSVQHETDLDRILASIGPEALLVVTPARTITGCNLAVQRLFGYSAAELIGQSTDLLYFDRRPNGHAREIHAALERVGFHVGRATGRKKNGEIFPLELATAKLQGSPGVLVLVHDITERKRVEEALLQARDELEARVAERTAELVQGQKRLRELASELSIAEENERRRIATSLHDGVGQTLALCKMSLARLSPAVERSEAAGKALHDLQALIEEAIRETRSLTFQLSPPILYELGLDAALEWLAEDMGQKYDQAVTFLSDEQAKPLDDSVRVILFQAARELVFNAIKHASPKHISIQSRRVDNGINLRVEDDGRGFDPSALDDRFLRQRGIGLFYIRERLMLMGGTLTVDSSPGQGTRVILNAPLDSRRQPAEGDAP